MVRTIFQCFARPFLPTLFIAVLLALSAVSGALAQNRAEPGYIGIEMQDVAAAEAPGLGLDAPTGVKVARTIPGSPAAGAGLLPGDVILSVDGSEIQGAAALRALERARTAGTSLRLRLLRDGRLRTANLTLAAQPRGPVIHPLPVIDTGGHRAKIEDVIFTRDGRYIVSAATDKTIRIWDWRANKLSRVIRGEAGSGHEGKIFALALSPDERWLAVGGYLGSFTGKKPSAEEEAHKIRLYDFATGRLVRLLKGHTNVINDLKFLPDSRGLVSGSFDNTAIIWDIESGAMRHRMSGHTGAISTLNVTPDGRSIFTGSYDTTVRMWRVADGQQIASLSGHAGKLRTIAVSRDGSMIASGDYVGEIRLWDGSSGSFMRTVARQQTIIGALAFSPDGSRLLSSISKSASSSIPYGAFVYDVASGRQLVRYSRHDNIVIAATISPDGRWAATGGGANNEIHVWSLTTGNLAKGTDGNPVILRGTGARAWATAFSVDGESIAWGTRWLRLDPGRGYGNPEYELRLAGPRLGLGAPAPVTDPSRFAAAIPERGGIRLSHRPGGTFGYDAILDVIRNGVTIASLERDSIDGYRHLSYSLAPSNKFFVTGGGNGSLHGFSLPAIERAAAKAPNRLLTGAPLRALAKSYIGHEGDVWAATPSRDGRFLVTGSDDQTIRLWNLETQELIITLFHGNDGEWIAFTPQGFYTGSPAGAERLLWQINRGPDKDPDIISAASVRRLFLRPDIIDSAIRMASAEAAVGAARGTNFSIDDLVNRPTPRISILSPKPNEVVSGGRAILEIDAPPAADPIKRISVKVDGALIDERVPSRDEITGGKFYFDIPLAAGENTITVVATNDTGDSEPARVTVFHRGEGALDQRGVLYVIAIGADEYDQAKAPSLKNLKFAGDDARAFVDAVSSSLKARHKRTETYLLANKPGAIAPTASNVRNTLSRVRNLATETDTVVFFIAGHGVNDRADYLFLPSNATEEGSGWAGSTVVPWVELERTLFSTLGRRILFVDTCHSAGAYNKKLDVEAYANDVTAFVATGPDELAVEFGKLGHGAFTYAIVQGLRDDAAQADNDNDRVVRVDELGQYLRDRTSALVDQYWPDYESRMGVPRPRPRVYRHRDAPNHILAEVR